MNIELMFIFQRTNLFYLSKSRIFHNVVLGKALSEMYLKNFFLMCLFERGRDIVIMSVCLIDYRHYNRRSISDSFRYYCTSTVSSAEYHGQITLPLNVADSIFNAITTTFLGSKNLSLTPYRMTDTHYSDQGFLKGIGNVTNNQTCIDTYLIN